MAAVAVSGIEADGDVRWQIWCNDDRCGFPEELWPGLETLMTTLEVEAPGRHDGWGFGGPKLYPGKPVHYGYSRADGLPVFVMARFEPSIDVIHIETTRRTITIPTGDFNIAFGLKYVARPLRSDEDLVSVYGDSSEREPIALLWPSDLLDSRELPPRSADFIPLP